MDYNQTIHLPQTDFPMRAGLPRREPELLNGKWEVETYRKLMERNQGKPKFILHDGPPLRQRPHPHWHRPEQDPEGHHRAL